MGEGLKVLIAAGQPIIRRGLKALLGAWDGLEIVGEAETGAETLAKLEQLLPHVVLMDGHLGPSTQADMTGSKVALSIKRRWAEVRVVLVTKDPLSLDEGCTHGVDVVLDKGFEPAALRRCLLALSAGLPGKGPAAGREESA